MPSNKDKPHPGYLYVTWPEVHMLVNAAVKNLRSSAYTIADVVAVSRGGLVPSRLVVAHMEALGIKTKLHFVHAVSYQNELQGLLTLTWEGGAGMPPADLNKRSTLIVDDLWDSGATFKAIKNAIPQAATLALMSKNAEADNFLDFCGSRIPTDKWVMWPWEEPKQPVPLPTIEQGWWQKINAPPGSIMTAEHKRKACDLWKAGEPMSYIYAHLKQLPGLEKLKKDELRGAIFERDFLV